jgi:hypothetical protein
MAYVKPLDVMDGFLAALRAWTGEPLASATFRKGPQHAATFGNAPALVLVGFKSLGEPGGGIGNNWWTECVIAVTILVPDSATAEDTRFDIVEEFGKFVLANRNLGTVGVQAGHILSCDFFAEPFFADVEQVFRGADFTVAYKTLRS